MGNIVEISSKTLWGTETQICSVHLKKSLKTGAYVVELYVWLYVFKTEQF